MIIAAAADDRDAVRSVWEGENDYEILEALNAGEALEILEKRNDVDLIFVDIILPETDGLNFLSRMKKKGAFAHIPVVVNTNPGKNAQVEKALVLGAEDFVPKPYNAEVLKKRIGNVMNRNLQDRDRLTNLYPSLTFYHQTKRMLLKLMD